MSKKLVTSGDVARLAKVSQSAVSRTFTPGASVSAGTRRKVEEAASALGYRPNALARAVISGQSRLIALMFAYLENQFYPVVLEGLSRKLQDAGYQVLLFMTDPGDRDDVVQRMLEYQVQGMVMASATLSSDLAGECAKNGIPVVLLNRYVQASPASSVTSDNVEGGRMAADHLVRGGHKRIAFIAGSADSSTNRDREAGFMKGLADHSMTLWAHGVGGYTHAGATSAARAMFTSPDRPDAVFVGNDHMAFAVMDVLRNELGLGVPEDVAVLGYDDVPEAGWGGYRLSTIEQPTGPMIDETVAILLDQIEKGAVSRRARVVPCRLITRETTRPVT